MSDRAQPIKVLAVDAADTGGRVYGAQRVVASLAARTAGRIEWSATVATERGEYPEQLRSAGVTVYGLPLRAPLPIAQMALSRLVRREGFDLVHTHDLRASAIARPVCGRLGVPMVTTYHEAFAQSHLCGLARLKRCLVVRLDRGSVGQVSRIVCVSQSMADELAASHGVDPAAIAVVPNGVDVESLQGTTTHEPIEAARRRLRTDQGDRVVAVVGNLSESKGQQVLLAAAPAVLERHPDTVFAFVGDGAARERLEALADELSVASRCRFVGFQDPIGPWMAAATVIAVPSLTEAFGLVALEAMALSRPVVASAVGGLAEIIEDGQTGLLVPPGDAPALAAALSRLLGDAQERARFGRNGAERVAARYTLDRQADGYLAVYRAAIRPARGVEG